jgi:YegS/Rv2252/BmrU family lipid kinase
VTTRVAIIINPISGTGGRRDILEARVGLARALAGKHGIDAQVLVSERTGHARSLAEGVLAAGFSDVVAWGGDGTINEVGGALAFRAAVLGVIPSGSGNGLARELGIPLTPEEAFAIAVGGRERVIDCGELDGHLFFNVAGIGLDARVAHEFTTRGLQRRGFRRYIEITLRQLFRYAPDEHSITVDGVTVRSRVLMVAIANSRQYGNGALIAPQARLDDGKLDVVVIDDRPVWRAILQIPKIFTGAIAQVPGVTMLRGEQIEVTSGRPVTFHIDGEAFIGAAHLRARVHRDALRVRVARDGGESPRD